MPKVSASRDITNEEKFQLGLFELINKDPDATLDKIQPLLKFVQQDGKEFAHLRKVIAISFYDYLSDIIWQGDSKSSEDDIDKTLNLAIKIFFLTKVDHLLDSGLERVLIEAFSLIPLVYLKNYGACFPRIPKVAFFKISGR